MLDTKNKEVVDYSANGFDYKLVKEEDNWWSIYRWHEFRQDYIPIIQACNLEKAKEYCYFCEAVTIPINKF